MNIVAVIPLRAGSKGFPGKNIVDLAGQPLFMHSVNCAREAGIERVIVATNITTLLQEPHNSYETFTRSAHSARDEAQTHEVLIEMIEALGLQDHVLVILQATSPLRRAETVRAVLTLQQQGRHEIVCSVSAMENSVLKAGFVEGDTLRPLVNTQTLFAPRQTLPPVYKLDGGVFACSGGWIVKNGSLATNSIGVVESHAAELLDIDSPEDLEFAKAQLERTQNNHIGKEQ